MRGLFLLLLGVVFLSAGIYGFSRSDIGIAKCVPYAYGDFNADKLVDIFCVSPSNFIEIWLAQETNRQFYLYKNFTIKNRESTIVNLIPSDFNGDSIMDVLVVYEIDSKNTFQMSLFLGNKSSKYENHIETDTEKLIAVSILDQPLAADFDGDGKTDLLVQESDKRTILYFGMDGGIVRTSTMDTVNKLYSGYANSITDVNSDFTPDLVLAAETPDSKTINYEQWFLTEGSRKYEFNNSYSTPNPNFIYGQSLFADFDSDGNIEHLLPACKDTDCKQSAIFIFKNNEWNELPINFGDYSFVPVNGKELWGQNTISVKAGDYDLNGFLDLLVILRDNNVNSTDKKREETAVLLKNVLNEKNKDANSFSRNFEVEDKFSELASINNVVQASFFDLSDNGYLDILLTVKNPGSVNPKYDLVALKNEFDGDVYFLKVMVIPGLCTNSRCPMQNLPYGLNYPGALVKMETVSFDFQRVVLYSCQLSQSSYMSLQLPYSIFGLGSTPNFVEELKVGLLSATALNEIKGLSKEWHQIIPNSQLVINPNPRNQPFYWRMQLFITPSNNILMTAISLGSTMICLIIVIGLLQYREKKMDEKERKIEAQRFHLGGI